MLVYGKNVLRELLNSDTVINKIVLSDNFNVLLPINSKVISSISEKTATALADEALPAK